MQRHHRKPKSRGGSGRPRNISVVRDDLHKAYHRLFKNMQPPEIAKLLNDVWIDPDYELIARKRE